MGPNLLRSAERAAAAVPIALASLALGFSARADAIDDYMQSAMARAHLPGAAVAVVHNGRIEKLAAYGVASLEYETPATVDTPFSLASGTKIFTGVLLMRLVDQGRIKLSDPVGRYLPGVPEAWASITVAHLAGHAGGLPENLNVATDADMETVAHAAEQQPLDFQPGSQSRYDQVEFAVLAAVMEKASGKPWARLLRDEVLDPLRLTETGYVNLREISGGPTGAAGSSLRLGDVMRGRAQIYQWTEGSQKTFEFLFPPWGYSGGGLYSSPRDLARLAVALDGDRFLSASAKEALFTPFRLHDGRSGEFAVAWYAHTYRGKRFAGHSGAAANSDVITLPDGRVTVVVLTNGQNILPVLAEGIVDRVVDLPAPTHTFTVDNEPVASARLLAVVRGLNHGVADSTAFAPALGPLVSILSLTMTLFPPPDSWRLVSATRNADGGSTRLYLAMHGRKPIVWSFTLAPEGKITAIWPATE